MQNAKAVFEAQFSALKVAAMAAREFVEGIKPGDYYKGLCVEAEERFERGSAGYSIFLQTAVIEMDKYAIDIDARGYVVSMAKRSDALPSSFQEVKDAINGNAKTAADIIERLHNDKVELLRMLIEVRDNVKDDSPDMWARVEALIARMEK